MVNEKDEVIGEVEKDVASSSTSSLLKRNYLNLFFKNIEIKNGKITKYYLTDELKELIANGSVRARTNGLPIVDDVRTSLKVQ